MFIMSSNKHVESEKEGMPLVQSLLPLSVKNDTSKVQEEGGALKHTDIQIKTTHKAPTSFLSYFKFNWHFTPFS